MVRGISPALAAALQAAIDSLNTRVHQLDASLGNQTAQQKDVVRALDLLKGLYDRQGGKLTDLTSLKGQVDAHALALDDQATRTAANSMSILKCKDENLLNAEARSEYLEELRDLGEEQRLSMVDLSARVNVVEHDNKDNKVFLHTLADRLDGFQTIIDNSMAEAQDETWEHDSRLLSCESEHTKLAHTVERLQAEIRGMHGPSQVPGPSNNEETNLGSYAEFPPNQTGEPNLGSYAEFAPDQTDEPDLGSYADLSKTEVLPTPEAVVNSDYGLQKEGSSPVASPSVSPRINGRGTEKHLNPGWSDVDEVLDGWNLDRQADAESPVTVPIRDDVSEVSTVSSDGCNLILGKKFYNTRERDFGQLNIDQYQLEVNLTREHPKVFTKKDISKHGILKSGEKVYLLDAIATVLEHSSGMDMEDCYDILYGWYDWQSGNAECHVKLDRVITLVFKKYDKYDEDEFLVEMYHLQAEDDSSVEFHFGKTDTGHRILKRGWFFSPSESSELLDQQLADKAAAWTRMLLKEVRTSSGRPTRPSYVDDELEARKAELFKAYNSEQREAEEGHW